MSIKVTVGGRNLRMGGEVTHRANPETIIQSIFTRRQTQHFLILLYDKKHSHKNITFEIINSTSVSGNFIFLLRNVQSCIECRCKKQVYAFDFDTDEAAVLGTEVVSSTQKVQDIFMGISLAKQLKVKSRQPRDQCYITKLFTNEKTSFHGNLQH